MKNTDLSVKTLLPKCYFEILETQVLKNYYKTVVSIFNAAPNKGTTILY